MGRQWFTVSPLLFMLHDVQSLVPSLGMSKRLFKPTAIRSSAEGLKEAFYSSSPAEKDKILDELCQLSRPDSTTAIEGRWRVAFAPHIATLGNVLATSFDEIIYDIGPENQITSHVHYSTIGKQSGWLSTSGTFEFSSREAISSVTWSTIWWDPSTEAPSKNHGAFANFIQLIGRVAFIDAFAHFPVQYLDSDLCVFLFPLSRTRIAATRQS